MRSHLLPVGLFGACSEMGVMAEPVAQAHLLPRKGLVWALTKSLLRAFHYSYIAAGQMILFTLPLCSYFFF